MFKLGQFTFKIKDKELKLLHDKSTISIFSSLNFDKINIESSLKTPFDNIISFIEFKL